MKGRHYDLARKMSSYWVNFIKTGDPNGVDFSEEQLIKEIYKVLENEGIDYQGKSLVLIGTGGAASAIAVTGALQGVKEIHIFNKNDDFYQRGIELCSIINDNRDCFADMNDLDDHDLLKKLMQEADIFCDASAVGMKPLDKLSNNLLIYGEKIYKIK